MLNSSFWSSYDSSITFFRDMGKKRGNKKFDDFWRRDKSTEVSFLCRENPNEFLQKIKLIEIWEYSTSTNKFW